MSDDKIKLNEAQMATLGLALEVAARATYHYADEAEARGDVVLAATLRSEAEDFEVMWGMAPYVYRITVRLNYMGHDALPVAPATRITF